MNHFSRFSFELILHYYKMNERNNFLNLVYDSFNKLIFGSISYDRNVSIFFLHFPKTILQPIFVTHHSLELLELGLLRNYVYRLRSSAIGELSGSTISRHVVGYIFASNTSHSNTFRYSSSFLQLQQHNTPIIHKFLQPPSTFHLK